MILAIDKLIQAKLAEQAGTNSTFMTREHYENIIAYHVAKAAAAKGQQVEHKIQHSRPVYLQYLKTELVCVADAYHLVKANAKGQELSLDERMVPTPIA